MRCRMKSDMSMKEPIDDEYGIDYINTMIADINTQYAAVGVYGLPHNAGAEGDEDEDEDGGSDQGMRPSRRYVSYI